MRARSTSLALRLPHSPLHLSPSADCGFNYTDADIQVWVAYLSAGHADSPQIFLHLQRIACSAKLGESGGIGFHEFVSSCSALFAGRMCAAKPDAFSTVGQPASADELLIIQHLTPCCEYAGFRIELLPTGGGAVPSVPRGSSRRPAFAVAMTLEVVIVQGCNKQTKMSLRCGREVY